MLAVVNTPNGSAPVELRQVPEPVPGPHDALVAVQAFSLNRGELRSFRNNEEGWIPGQDVSGIVLQQAADGSGPPAGARVVASNRRIRLGGTRRGAGASHGGAAGLCQFRRRRGAAGRRPDGVAHVATRRAIAGQARADHRARPAASAIWRCSLRRDPARASPPWSGGRNAPRACRNWAQPRSWSASSQAQGRFGLILESAGGASLATALHLVEAKGAVVVFGNSSGEPTSIGVCGFPRRAECAVAKLLLFHLRTGGTVRTGPGVAGVAGGRQVADAADGAGTKLARTGPGCRGIARAAARRQGGVPRRAVDHAAGVSS